MQSETHYAGDADSDSDSDADADSDGDTDTDTSVVDCPTIPSVCDDIGADAAAQYAGCCWGDMVYWRGYGSTTVSSMDCAALLGTACGYDATSAEMQCIF